MNDNLKIAGSTAYNNRRFTLPTTDQPYSSRSTSSALMTSSNTSQTKRYSNLCRYCDKHHWSDECEKYQTISERKQQLRNSCHKCLNVSHRSTDCKRNKFCFHCGVSNVHHRSLCPQKFQLRRSNESIHASEEITKMSNQSVDSDENVLISSGEMILMQTAKTELKNPLNSSSQQTRILLDCGSQRTYITEQLATTLGLERGEETEINLVTFGSEQSKVLKTTSTKLDIKLKNGTVMQIVANIVRSITETIYRKPLKKAPSDEYNYLVNSLDMADSIPTECESSTIELLLGNDYYLDLILSQKIEIQPGFYFLASKLGWILTGRTGVIEDEHDDTNMLVLTYKTNVTETNVFTGVDEILSTKPIIEDFRKKESIGIEDKTEDTADEKAMKTLKQKPRRENGKYQVAWPWKGDTSDFPENRGLLLDRLKSLTNKLNTQPEFMTRCDTIFQDQLNDGVVEEVDRESCDEIKYYNPYHIVIKPLKATANLRVVYDASDKIRKKYKSYNECLYRCHVLICDLCDMILRSMLPKIGSDSVIEKTFLQVELQPPERDVTRKRIQIVV